ncbi:sodium:proton symporter [Bosea sp. BK604]|uniref:sodium:proton symporter n=1 Tax=Bosea sp. BK604 TaxID=2512180 RepID=UPI00104BEBE5|nr:sodium:proton symporter [Bosea sp. BK604]TCR63551.1 BASS family bile acid:Na+ symporter [Bosea sp. BK604]
MFSRFAAFLAWLGRYGTQGFALSIFLGLALPQFSSAARPLLPVTIFCFTTVVFLRADFGIIAGLIRRPARLIAACLWLLAAPMLIVGLGLVLVGRAALDPGLVLGLAIMCAAPPIMSSPAVAIIYGFEPSLLIATTILTTLLSPIVAPLVVELVAGAAVPLDRWALTLRLIYFIGGGIVVAAILRRVLGGERIRAMKANLDGFGVLMYFIFAIAAMDGVTRAALERPTQVLTFLAVTFAIAASGLVLASLLLRNLKLPERFMIGYGTGQRNMGLLVAALGAGVPPTTFLYFALAQFPIYLLPWLLRGVAARIRRAEKPADAG